MNARLSLALAAFGVLLVACAVPTGGPFLPFATVTSSQSPFYANHLVIGAARNGLMPVVIINNPFGASNVDAVSAVMKGPDWAGTFKFQSAGAGRTPALHVVVAFDAATDATQRSNICRVPAASALGSGALRVIAAFCNGSEPLSIASATAPRPRSISDGSFRRLMVSVSNSVFPIVEYGTQGR